MSGGCWAVESACLALDKPQPVPGDPTAPPVCVSDHSGVEATLVLRPACDETLPASTPPASRPASLAAAGTPWSHPVYDVWPLQPLGGLLVDVPEIREAAKVVDASLLRGSTSPRRLRGRLSGSTMLASLFGVVLAIGVGTRIDGAESEVPPLGLALAAAMSGAVVAAQLCSGALQALASPWALCLNGLLAAAAVAGLVLWWLLLAPGADWFGVMGVWCASFAPSLAASADAIGAWVQATSSPFNASELRSRLRWLKAIQRRWVEMSRKDSGAPK